MKKFKSFQKVAYILALTLPLWASQVFALGPRPLDTESAETLKPGEVEVSVGMEYQDGNILPFDTLKRDRELTKFPVIGLALGVDKRVELQVLYDYLSLDETGGRDESGGGDLRLWTKVRIMEEKVDYPAL
ncbi:MAG: hypothetical protein HY878_05670, partial [Deltaproteobacteria bacterium]|nr:hypothetical protein [Deltaproteobacteria bacterium]